MLNYKKNWHKIKPTKWLIKFNLTRMKLGYMNSRRPSKPNLPNVPKPSMLLAPTRLCRTFVFSSLLNSAIAHSINQYQLAPSELLPKALKSLLTDMSMVRKGFG